MKLIVVTGTNGKTTMAYLMYQALNLLNKKCAYLGRDTYGRMAYFKSKENLIGQFVQVKIIKTGGISLIGEII